MPGEQGKVIITSHKPELMALFKEYCTFHSSIEDDTLYLQELKFEFAWPYTNVQAEIVLYGSGGWPLWRRTNQEHTTPPVGYDGGDSRNTSTLYYARTGRPATIKQSRSGSQINLYRARGGEGAKDVITVDSNLFRIHTLSNGVNGYDSTLGTRQTGAMENDGAHGLGGRLPTTDSAEFSVANIAQSATGGNGEKLVRTVSFTKGDVIEVVWGAKYKTEYEDEFWIEEESQNGFVSITPQ